MKKIIFAFLLIPLLLALTIYSYPRQPGLFSDTPFISKEGRFSIVLPADFPKFDYELRDKGTDAGIIKIHYYAATTNRGNCTLVYYDIPDSALQYKSIKQILEDTRDGVIGDGKLNREKAITINSHPGISFSFTQLFDGKLVYCQSSIVIANQRTYNYLFATYDESELSKADVKNFFNSFQIQGP